VVVVVHLSTLVIAGATCSSWLDQIERCFAKIERDILARGVFTSVADLKRKIMKYTRYYNTLAKPIRWTCTDRLVASPDLQYLYLGQSTSFEHSPSVLGSAEACLLLADLSPPENSAKVHLSLSSTGFSVFFWTEAIWLGILEPWHLSMLPRALSRYIRTSCSAQRNPFKAPWS
jgi:hypothetical protein